MPRKLMLTVDVEAQPGRAVSDHVDRLIWGRFPEGRAGIGEMMDVADHHGAKLTMFLDWAETDLYGEAIRDVGKEIHRRGHDLQLHVHTDFFKADFWNAKGVARQTDLNKLSREQAEAIASEIVERQAASTGIAPLAFRGGGYRFSAPLLTALFNAGVKLDSSINISRPTQPAPLPLTKQFCWTNGMIEIPVSCVEGYRNISRPYDFNFNSLGFFDPERANSYRDVVRSVFVSRLADSTSRMNEYLDVFWRERGEEAIAVLVMHSWSLLRKNGDGAGHFTFAGTAQIERFDAFLAGLPANVEVMTAADLTEAHRKGELAMDEPIELSRLSGAEMPREQIPQQVTAREPAISASMIQISESTPNNCPICGSAKVNFVQLNGRKCPGCGSVERQRCFAVAYENGIRHHFDISGKNVLIFSPSESELRFLNEKGIASKQSADIRPEMKPDMVLDMCSMPSVKSSSQECVFASYLMPVVYDMGAALDEVERILAPAGAFISVEPVQPGRPTREVADRKIQASWYGAETLEKYRVGSYRVLGETDYPAELERRFRVECFTARDPITNQVNHIYLCWSKKQAGTLHSLFKTGKSKRGGLRTMSETKKPDFAATLSKEDLHAAAEALWADQGNAESQRQSVDLFRQLYELGDKVPAGYRLGTAYYQGRGVGRDIEKAYEYLSVPELDKVRFALYFRGLVLKDPHFSGRDDVQAREALSKAYEMGVEAAATHLVERPALPVNVASSPPQEQPHEGKSHVKSNAVTVPCPKGDEKFRDYDSAFYEEAIINGSMPYAEFMMRRHWEKVATGIKHASLGKNVPDRDEKGRYNFEYYKKIVGFDNNSKVIDFGCGTLRIGQFFIEYLDQNNYFGLDVEKNFIETGISMLDKNTIHKKKPTFGQINKENLKKAKDFSADFIFSNSVAYHVHQSDIEVYLKSLSRLASNPNSVLIFDAKISDQALRYNSGGWAWPLELYTELLHPLKLVRLHGEKPYGGYDCTVAHLEFRHNR